VHTDFPERIDASRLVLRRWTEDDRGAFGAIWTDRDVAASLFPGGVPDSGYAMRRFDHHLEHWAEHGFGQLAVEERATGGVIGWAGPAYLDFVPGMTHEVELGWTLRRPYWGRGLATEAARAALEASLQGIDAERIVSVIDPDNDRSIAVARRLRMTETGEIARTQLGYELLVYAAASGASSSGA
jgi:RimJ/RimL family protein N-acetyltransferase